MHGVLFTYLLNPRRCYCAVLNQVGGKELVMARNPAGATVLSQLLTDMEPKLQRQTHSASSNCNEFPLSGVVLARLLEAGGAALLESTPLQNASTGTVRASTFHQMLAASKHFERSCLAQILDLMPSEPVARLSFFSESVAGQGMALHVALRNAQHLSQSTVLRIIGESSLSLLHRYAERQPQTHMMGGFGQAHVPVAAERNGELQSALQVALLNANHVSDAVFETLLMLDAREQLDIKTRESTSSLSLAFEHASTVRASVLHRLLDCCHEGDEVLNSKNQSGHTVLQIALANHQHVPLSAFRRLIDVGGPALLAVRGEPLPQKAHSSFGPADGFGASSLCSGSLCSGTALGFALTLCCPSAEGQDVRMSDASGGHGARAVGAESTTATTAKLGAIVTHILAVGGTEMFLLQQPKSTSFAVVAKSSGGPPDDHREALRSALVQANTHLVFGIERARHIPPGAVTTLLLLRDSLKQQLEKAIDKEKEPLEGLPRKKQIDDFSRRESSAVDAALAAARHLSDDELEQALDVLKDDVTERTTAPLTHVALENARFISEANMLKLLKLLTENCGHLVDMGWSAQQVESSHENVSSSSSPFGGFAQPQPVSAAMSVVPEKLRQALQDKKIPLLQVALRHSLHITARVWRKLLGKDQAQAAFTCKTLVMQYCASRAYLQDAGLHTQWTMDADFVVFNCGASEFLGSYRAHPGEDPRGDGFSSSFVHLWGGKLCNGKKHFVKVNGLGAFYASGSALFACCYFDGTSWRLTNHREHSYHSASLPGPQGNHPPNDCWQTSDHRVNLPAPSLRFIDAAAPLLHECLKQKTPEFVIAALINAGAASLLGECDLKKQTAIHAILINKFVTSTMKISALDTLSKTTAEQAKKILLQKCHQGHNLLHAVLHHAQAVPERVILKVVDVGGNDLLADLTSDGFTSLQLALMNARHVSLRVINVILESTKLLPTPTPAAKTQAASAISTTPNTAGASPRANVPRQTNALHTALAHAADVPGSVLERLLDPTWSSDDALLAQDRRSGELAHTVLHTAVENVDHISTKLLIRLIKRGGAALIMKERSHVHAAGHEKESRVVDSSQTQPGSRTASYAETPLSTRVPGKSGETLTAITAQDEFAELSFEELRYQDTPTLYNTPERAVPAKPAPLPVKSNVLHDVLNQMGNLLKPNAFLHVDVMRCLIDVGTDLSLMAKTSEGKNALHLALANPRIPFSVLSQLIQVGGPSLVASTDKDEANALHAAVGLTHLPFTVLENLFSVCTKQEQKALVCAQNVKGETPLHLSLQRGDPCPINLLVKYGAHDVLSITDSKGLSPFTTLALLQEQFAPAVYSSLLSNLLHVGGRSMLSATTEAGDNALHTMARHGSFKSMPTDVLNRALVSGGSGLLSAQNASGDTVLHVALGTWAHSLTDDTFSRVLKLSGDDVHQIRNHDNETCLNVALKSYVRRGQPMKPALPAVSAPRVEKLQHDVVGHPDMAQCESFGVKVSPTTKCYLRGNGPVNVVSAESASAGVLKWTVTNSGNSSCVYGVVLTKDRHVKDQLANHAAIGISNASGGSQHLHKALKFFEKETNVVVDATAGTVAFEVAGEAALTKPLSSLDGWHPGTPVTLAVTLWAAGSVEFKQPPPRHGTALSNWGSVQQQGFGGSGPTPVVFGVGASGATPTPGRPSSAVGSVTGVGANNTASAHTSECPVAWVQQLVAAGGQRCVALSSGSQGVVQAAIRAHSYPAAVKETLCDAGGEALLGRGWTSTAGGRAGIVNWRYICQAMAGLCQEEFSTAYDVHFKDTALLGQLLAAGRALPDAGKPPSSSHLDHPCVSLVVVR